MTPGSFRKTGPDLSIKEEYIEQVCSHLRKYAFRETAYAVIPVAKETVRNWYNRGKRELAQGIRDTLCARFTSAVDETERQVETELVGAIANSGLENFLKSSSDKGDTFERADWKALQWIVEHRFRARWGFKVEITHHLEECHDLLLDIAEKVLTVEKYGDAFERLCEALQSETDAKSSCEPPDSESED